MNTKRKSARLHGWDYSSNAYYHVIICTNEKRHLFGSVALGSNGAAIVKLSALGAVCDCCMSAVEDCYDALTIVTSVIMPNHVHMLLSIEDAGTGVSLGRIVRHFKSMVTREARKGNPSAVVWQRNYYEHIIRGERDFRSTWEYIENNPANWIDDEYYA